jgi:hypothetical protein
MIYTLDHAPAHVHLVGTEGRAKVALNCPDGPALPIDVRGCDAPMLKKMLQDIGQALPMLCQAWRSMHGSY